MERYGTERGTAVPTLGRGDVGSTSLRARDGRIVGVAVITHGTVPVHTREEVWSVSRTDPAIEQLNRYGAFNCKGIDWMRKC